MRFFIITIIALFTGVAGFSQEILTGLQTNPMVQAKVLELARMKSTGAGLDTIPVNLPFFDDFSANAVFPSNLRWIDHYALKTTSILCSLSTSA